MTRQHIYIHDDGKLRKLSWQEGDRTRAIHKTHRIAIKIINELSTHGWGLASVSRSLFPILTRAGFKSHRVSHTYHLAAQRDSDTLPPLFRESDLLRDGRRVMRPPTLHP